MPEIYLPFVQGQHEETDARILPAGMLSRAENVRIRKDGRLVSRYGYALEPNPPANVARTIEVQGGALLLTGVACAKKDSAGILTAALPNENLYGLPAFAGVTRYPAARGLRGTVGYVDCCVVNATSANATIIAAWTDSYNDGLPESIVWYRIYSRNGDTLYSQLVSWSFGTKPRLAASGAAAYCMMRDPGSTANEIHKFNPTTRAFAVDGSLAATQGATNEVGDIICLDEDNVLYTVYTAPTWKLRRYKSSTHADTAVATLSYGTSDPAAFTSLALLNNGNVLVITTSGTNVYYQTVQADGTPVAAGAIATGVAQGSATACAYGASGWICIVNGAFAVYVYTDASAGTSLFTINNAWAQTRPFACSVNGTTRYYVWLTDCAVVTPLVGEPLPAMRLVEVPPSQYYYLRADATAMQQEHIGVRTDSRVSVAVLPVPAAAPTLPARIVTHGIGRTPVEGGWAASYSDIVAVDHGSYSDGLNEVTADGHTFVAGARLHEWDTTQTFPAGLEAGPCRIAATDTGIGSGPDTGSHQYVACWKHIDAQGNIHRSPPCAPITVSTTGHAVSVALPLGNLIPFAPYSRFPVLEVYRTVVSPGTVFHLCATSVAGVASVADTMTDATLIAQPILYTQGERGGISGLLPNDEPPPCRYICAGDSRLLIGGLENPNEVQWSKLFYPGEAVTWTIDEAYRRTLPEPVTAVSFLDGSWLVFTAEGIYDLAGDGPSDNGKDGDFGEPRKRPSDTGCISHRSLVTCAQGILFQGTNGGIWLLPRGGNAPVWIGQPVRDVLASFPVVRDAALIEAENCVYWALSNTAATAGMLLVYDLRNSQWYVDTLPDSRNVNSLTRFTGNLLLDGVILQTPGAYSDNMAGSPTAITATVTTGDIRPFDATGWGRCRLFGILGEFRSECTLGAWLSYDNGTTWTIYSWALTGTPGDEVNAQFGPARVRGTNYRVKLTVTPTGTGGEGLALNVLALEVYKAERLKRLPAAQRG